MPPDMKPGDVQLALDGFSSEPMHQVYQKSLRRHEIVSMASWVCIVIGWLSAVGRTVCKNLVETDMRGSAPLV